MALGASGTIVRRMVLGETLWMVAIGVVAGLPCAIAAARLISSRLYGLGPIDPVSIAGAIFVVFLSGVLAGYLRLIAPPRSTQCTLCGTIDTA